MSAISQSTVAESPLATEPDAFTVYYAELEIGGTDVVTVRYALREFFTESAPLAISATPTTSNRHDYITASVMYSTDSGVGYEFNKLTLDQLAESGGIPAGPITVNTIGDEQYIGYQNTHWNQDPAPLEIDVTSQEKRVRGFTAVAPLEISVTTTAVYREAVRLNVVDTINLATTFTELHYYFADPDRTISPGIPVGPISVNTIAQEQFIGYQYTHWNQDPAPLDIDVISQEKRVRGFISSAPLELGLTDIAYYREAVRLNVVDTIALDLGVTELHYFFADADRTISPGIPVGPISVNTISQEQFIGHQFNHWNRDPAPLDITATVVEKRIFNRPNDNAALEIDATFTAYKRDAVRLNVTDPAEFVFGYSELSYYFPGPDPDRGVPLPIGPISIASITELQYVSGEYGKTYTIDATVALVIDVDFTYTYPTQALATVEETVELLWFGESLPTVTHNIVSTANLAVVNIQAVTSSSANDNTVALAISVTSDVRQKFVIASTVNLAVVDIQSVEYQANLNDSVALALTATDVVKQIVLISDSTAELDITATTTVSNKFDVSSTAVLAVVDIQSVEYHSITSDVAALTLGATSQVTRVALITDTTAAFEVAASATLTNKYVQADTGSVVLADTATAIFSAKIDTTGVLELDGTGELNTFKVYEYSTTGEVTLDSTSTFSRAFAYSDSANLAVVDIVSNETTSANDNTVALAITATTVTSTRSVFADNANLAVVDIDSTAIASNADNTVALEISATTTLSRAYAYSDSANLAVVDIVSNETTSATDNTVALDIAVTQTTSSTLVYLETAAVEIAASAVVSKSFTLISTTDNVIAATADTAQIFKFADSANLAVVDIVSTAIASNVDNDVVLTLSATAVFGQTHIFDDSAVLAVVDIVSNETTTATDNTVALEIGVTEAVSATSAYAETAAVEIDATTVTFASVTLETTAAVELSAATAIEQQFVFDDSAVLAIVDIVSNDIASNVDNDVVLALAATATVSRAYAYSDSANLAVVDIQSVETTSATDNTAVLEIEVTQTTSSTLAYAETATVEIAATTTASKSFTYDDNAVLAIVDIVSNETTTATDNTVALEIAATTVLSIAYAYSDSANLAIVDIQSVETTSAADNTAALEINATDAVQQIFEFSTTANLAVVDIVSNTIASNVDNDVVLDLAVTTAIEQKFNFVDSAVLAVVDIVSTSIASNVDNDVSLDLAVTSSFEQKFNFVESADAELAVTAIAGQTFVFDDTGNIAIVDIQSIEYTANVEDSSFLDFAVTDVVAQIFDFDTSVDTEIEATALFGQTYVFDDTGTIAIVDIQSIEYTANVEDSSFLDLAASAAIEQKFVFDDTAGFDIDAYALSGLTYQIDDTGNLAVVDIASVEYTSNVDNTVFWDLAAETAFTQEFNFVSTTGLTLTNMPVRSFLSLPATPFEYVKTNNGNDATITFNGENRGDGLPGDVSSLINALTNTMFFPGPGQQIFIDGSPFQYYGTITDVNVGQLQDGSYEISISVTDASTAPAGGSLVTGTGIQFDNTFVTEFGITRIFNYGVESADQEFNSETSFLIISNLTTDAAVEIATEEIVAQIYNYVDTTDLEFAATALFGQTYIFDDSANLAVVDIVSNEITSNVDNTTFFEFVASDTVQQIFAFAETAAVEIAATADVVVVFAFDSTVETLLEDQSTTSTALSYTDTGNLAVVDIVANEITSNVDNTTFFEFVVEQSVQQIFNIVESADILIGDQNTNTTSLNYVDTSNMAVVNIQSISVKYNIEDIPFVTYNIDTAIEQKFVFEETATAALGADVATSMTMAVSNVTAVDLMAEASNSILSNVVQDPQLDIAADYLTQSSRSDVASVYADLDVVDNIGLTKSFYPVDHIGDIMGYSFTKGYTLFKQEYSNEPVELSLGAVSGEIQVISGGGQPVTSSKQIWIG